MEKKVLLYHFHISVIDHYDQKLNTAITLYCSRCKPSNLAFVVKIERERFCVENWKRKHLLQDVALSIVAIAHFPASRGTLLGPSCSCNRCNYFSVGISVCHSTKPTWASTTGHSAGYKSVRRHRIHRSATVSTTCPTTETSEKTESRVSIPLSTEYFKLYQH